MLTIRPVRADEASALYALRLRAVATDPDAFDQTPETVQEAGEELLAEAVAASVAGRDLVLVTEDEDGDRVGIVLVTHSRRPRSQHRARLWGMWVAPEVRGQGVAGRLLAEVVAWCRGRGIELVDLWVVADHVQAVRVYQRAGWRIVGTTPDGMRWQGKPQAEYQMVIQLPPEV